MPQQLRWVIRVSPSSVESLSDILMFRRVQQGRCIMLHYIDRTSSHKTRILSALPRELSNQDISTGNHGLFKPVTIYGSCKPTDQPVLSGVPPEI